MTALKRAAFLLTPLLVALSLVSVASAAGNMADQMCTPYFAECGCGEKPNPHKGEQGQPACIKGANTHDCKTGICFDDTNDHYVEGHCVAFEKCQEDLCDGQKCKGSTGGTSGSPAPTVTPSPDVPSGTPSPSSPSTPSQNNPTQEQMIFAPPSPAAQPLTPSGQPFSNFLQQQSGTPEPTNVQTTPTEPNIPSQYFSQQFLSQTPVELTPPAPSGIESTPVQTTVEPGAPVAPSTGFTPSTPTSVPTSEPGFFSRAWSGVSSTFTNAMGSIGQDYVPAAPLSDAAPPTGPNPLQQTFQSCVSSCSNGEALATAVSTTPTTPEATIAQNAIPSQLAQWGNAQATADAAAQQRDEINGQIAAQRDIIDNPNSTDGQIHAAQARAATLEASLGTVEAAAQSAQGDMARADSRIGDLASVANGGDLSATDPKVQELVDTALKDKEGGTLGSATRAVGESLKSATEATNNFLGLSGAATLANPVGWASGIYNSGLNLAGNPTVSTQLNELSMSTENIVASRIGDGVNVTAAVIDPLSGGALSRSVSEGIQFAKAADFTGSTFAGQSLGNLAETRITPLSSDLTLTEIRPGEYGLPEEPRQLPSPESFTSAPAETSPTAVAESAHPGPTLELTANPTPEASAPAAEEPSPTYTLTPEKLSELTQPLVEARTPLTPNEATAIDNYNTALKNYSDVQARGDPAGTPLYNSAQNRYVSASQALEDNGLVTRPASLASEARGVDSIARTNGEVLAEKPASYGVPSFEEPYRIVAEEPSALTPGQQMLNENITRGQTWADSLEVNGGGIPGRSALEPGAIPDRTPTVGFAERAFADPLQDLLNPNNLPRAYESGASLSVVERDAIEHYAATASQLAKLRVDGIAPETPLFNSYSTQLTTAVADLKAMDMHVDGYTGAIYKGADIVAIQQTDVVPGVPPYAIVAPIEQPQTSIAEAPISETAQPPASPAALINAVPASYAQSVPAATPVSSWNAYPTVSNLARAAVLATGIIMNPVSPFTMGADAKAKSTTAGTRDVASCISDSSCLNPETGLASRYQLNDKGVNGGSNTASGYIPNAQDMQIASQTYPLGTFGQLCNGSRCVDVFVGDTGDFNNAKYNYTKFDLLPQVYNKIWPSGQKEDMPGRVTMTFQPLGVITPVSTAAKLVRAMNAGTPLETAVAQTKAQVLAYAPGARPASNPVAVAVQNVFTDFLHRAAVQAGTIPATSPKPSVKPVAVAATPLPRPAPLAKEIAPEPTTLVAETPEPLAPVKVVSVESAPLPEPYPMLVPVPEEAFASAEAAPATVAVAETTPEPEIANTPTAIQNVPQAAAEPAPVPDTEVVANAPETTVPAEVTSSPSPAPTEPATAPAPALQQIVTTAPQPLPTPTGPKPTPIEAPRVAVVPRNPEEVLGSGGAQPETPLATNPAPVAQPQPVVYDSSAVTGSQVEGQVQKVSDAVKNMITVIENIPAQISSLIARIPEARPVTYQPPLPEPPPQHVVVNAPTAQPAYAPVVEAPAPLARVSLGEMYNSANWTGIGEFDNLGRPAPQLNPDVVTDATPYLTTPQEFAQNLIQQARAQNAPAVPEVTATPEPAQEIVAAPEPAQPVSTAQTVEQKLADLRAAQADQNARTTAQPALEPAQAPAITDQAKADFRTALADESARAALFAEQAKLPKFEGPGASEWTRIEELVANQKNAVPSVAEPVPEVAVATPGVAPPAPKPDIAAETPLPTGRPTDIAPETITLPKNLALETGLPKLEPARINEWANLQELVDAQNAPSFSKIDLPANSPVLSAETIPVRDLNPSAIASIKNTQAPSGYSYVYRGLSQPYEAPQVSAHFTTDLDYAIEHYAGADGDLVRAAVPNSYVRQMSLLNRYYQSTDAGAPIYLYPPEWFTTAPSVAETAVSQGSSIESVVENIQSRPLTEGEDVAALQARKQDIEKLAVTLNDKSTEITNAFNDIVEKHLGVKPEETSLHIVGGNTGATKPFALNSDIDVVIGADPPLVPNFLKQADGSYGTVSSAERVAIANDTYAWLKQNIPEVVEKDLVGGREAFKVEIKGIGQETPTALRTQELAEGDIVHITTTQNPSATELVPADAVAPEVLSPQTEISGTNAPAVNPVTNTVTESAQGQLNITPEKMVIAPTQNLSILDRVKQFFGFGEVTPASEAAVQTAPTTPALEPQRGTALVPSTVKPTESAPAPENVSTGKPDFYVNSRGEVTRDLPLNGEILPPSKDLVVVGGGGGGAGSLPPGGSTSGAAEPGPSVPALITERNNIFTKTCFATWTRTAVCAGVGAGIGGIYALSGSNTDQDTSPTAIPSGGVAPATAGTAETKKDTTSPAAAEQPKTVIEPELVKLAACGESPDDPACVKAIKEANDAVAARKAQEAADAKAGATPEKAPAAKVVNPPPAKQTVNSNNTRTNTQQNVSHQGPLSSRGPSAASVGGGSAGGGMGSALGALAGALMKKPPQPQAPLAQPLTPTPTPINPTPVTAPISPVTTPLVRPAPSIILRADPTTVASGSKAILIWSSTNSDSCTVSDAAGLSLSNGIIGGSTSTYALSTTTAFTLSCIGSVTTTATTSVVVR